MNAEGAEKRRVHGNIAVALRWAFLGILLLAVGAPLVAQTKKAPPEKPLDLNTASVEELQAIPGVGPTIAKSIVRFREKSGPFKRVEDLLAIRGITKTKLEKMKPYVTVGTKAQDPEPEQAGSPVPGVQWTPPESRKGPRPRPV
jgi:competence ComEA-like helix-hairpin-helix protein